MSVATTNLFSFMNEQLGFLFDPLVTYHGGGACGGPLKQLTYTPRPLRSLEDVKAAAAAHQMRSPAGLYTIIESVGLPIESMPVNAATPGLEIGGMLCFLFAEQDEDADARALLDQAAMERMMYYCHGKRFRTSVPDQGLFANGVGPARAIFGAWYCLRAERVVFDAGIARICQWSMRFHSGSLLVDQSTGYGDLCAAEENTGDDGVASRSGTYAGIVHGRIKVEITSKTATTLGVTCTFYPRDAALGVINSAGNFTAQTREFTFVGGPSIGTFALTLALDTNPALGTTDYDETDVWWLNAWAEV